MIRLRGEAIRSRRRALGMSQRRLGKLAGMNSNALYQVENSENGGKYLRLIHLGRLADALGVEPAWLLQDSDAPAPSDDSANTRAQREDLKNDAQCVGSLLIGQEPLPVEALAVSLAWELPRVHAALAVLTQHLPLIGAGLRHVDNRVQIVPDTIGIDDKSLGRLTRLRMGTRIMDLDEMRIFNRLRTEKMSAMTLDRLLRKHAARRLISAGLICEPRTVGDPPQLGPDVYTSERVVSEYRERQGAASTSNVETGARPRSEEATDSSWTALIHSVDVPRPTEMDWPRIRQWARENGFTVGTHGGLRAEILDAYLHREER